ncbi:hypothetical protein GCM10020220_059760 [Nonomuraea rubra]
MRSGHPVATPALASRPAGNHHADPAREERISMASASYLLSSAAGAVPFGLFAGVTPVEIGRPATAGDRYTASGFVLRAYASG